MAERQHPVPLVLPALTQTVGQVRVHSVILELTQEAEPVNVPHAQAVNITTAEVPEVAKIVVPVPMPPVSETLLALLAVPEVILPPVHPNVHHVRQEPFQKHPVHQVVLLALPEHIPEVIMQLPVLHVPEIHTKI